MRLGRNSFALALVAQSIASLAGCGADAAQAQSPGWLADTNGDKNASSGVEAERFFPLVDGHIYNYRTTQLGDAGAQAGMLMLRVHRQSATVGELRRPVGTQRFEYGPLGVGTSTKTGNPAYLFKWPPSPEARWLGPQGGESRVTATDVAVTTPAGSYQGCMTLLEERRGDVRTRISTTLCPDVGIVALEVESGGAVERAELVYYGPPFDVGPEGTRRVE